MDNKKNHKTNPLPPSSLLSTPPLGKDLPYVLLDSGEGRRLELLGEILVDRSSPVAFWKKSLSAKEWGAAHAFHHRSSTGGGHWESRRNIPEAWAVQHGLLRLKTKLTSFGHLGFFPEQFSEWNFFHQFSQSKEVGFRALNLFAYTGGSTLALALGGAQVTHVDAAKNIVDWARENAELNAVPSERLRFIVDDCIKFLHRDARRGQRYKAIVLDPPSYGRGPKGEIFKLEDSLHELLEAVAAVLDPSPYLVHFSCHSPGFTPAVMANICKDYFPHFKNIEGHEMLVPDQNGTHPLASGAVIKLWN